jgi:DNA repair exonuclease SbcCD ATPase subunit
MSRRKLSKAQYIEDLENLADQKTAEVDSLMARLHHQAAAKQQLDDPNPNLAAETRRLKSDLVRLRTKVGHYVVRHREEKAEQRTRELRDLAELRRQLEVDKAELFTFVLTELGPFVGGQYGLDEQSVRRIVARAAAILRRANVPSN